LTVAAPLYLSEIAPISLRGFAGVFNQLAITLGVMISEILGLGFILGTDSLWKYAVGKNLNTYSKCGKVTFTCVI
jgi:hypothetical protein